VAQLNPGEVFVKSWTMVNTGAKAWPVGTTFSIISGANFKVNNLDLIALKKSVEPGEKHTWEVNMSAPPEAGSYVVSFGLKTNKGVSVPLPFGGGVCRCSVQVIKNRPF